jgi:hypothetical protein
MKIFKKRWFWISVAILLIFSIIFDLVILNLWAINSISSGMWDIRLLLVAGALIFSDGVGSIFEKWKLQSSGYTRLIFFVLVIYAVSIHGFWSGLVFMSLVLILSRLVRLFIWVIKKLIEKYKKRGLLKEI